MERLQRVRTIRVHPLVIFILLVPLVFVSFYIWPYGRAKELHEFSETFDNRSHSLNRVQKNIKIEPFNGVTKKVKTILYWTRMFSSDNFYFGDGDIFEGCPVWHCMGTNDREYQSIEKFDAIMFHGPELNANDLPKIRPAHQRYIFMDLETQTFHPIPDKKVFNNFFNWSMTYRRDADIMRPYGVFANLTSNQIIPPYIPAQWVNVSGAVIPESTRISFRGKSKIAAWFVSHCVTNSKRENIASKLQKHVRIDIYGKCGELKCPRTLENECYKKLESEYFFYLSFENSMCEDYLSEKVYKALELNVIPIVYGAADYESFLPPNSYINVSDFSSIEELAKFLIELSKDEERYLGYFKWKNFYKLVNDKRYIICEFCKALHDKNLPRKTIGDIYQQWARESHCRPPLQIS